MEDRIKNLKNRVFEANIFLWKKELIKLTWGNVSEIDRELEVIAIKPSGVSYEKLTPDDIVLTNLNGDPIEEGMKPSSDLMTHVFLYKSFFEINSVSHTHSTNAVKWAQSGKDIPILGTTHADAFYGAIPCTKKLTEQEVIGRYELETGKVIVETFKNRNINPSNCPAVLVCGHGPFTFGYSCKEAVENSLILEEVADMALGTVLLNPQITPIDSFLQDKHYFRKHGKYAYYGQKDN